MIRDVIVDGKLTEKGFGMHVGTRTNSQSHAALLRLTITSLALAGLAWTLGARTSTVLAAEGEARVIYLRQPVFRFPIHVEPERVKDLRELQLHVSYDQGRTWDMKEAMRPTDRSFTFSAPSDGEYCFSLVYVDKKGNATPRNVSAEPPQWRVVVDTKAPIVQLREQSSSDGVVQVAWRVDEEQLDVRSMKLEVKSQKDPRWREVTIRQGRQGQASWEAAVGEDYSVRATVRDRAGNENVAQIEIPAATVRQASARVPADRVRRDRAVSDASFQAPPPPMHSTQQEPRVLGDASRTRSMPPVARANRQSAATQNNVQRIPSETQSPVFERGNTAYPEGWTTAPAPANPQATNYEQPNPSWMMAAASRIPIASTREKITQTASQPSAPKRTPKKTHISNSPRIEVNYAVRNMGPSGVGKVQLFYTKDNGKEWTLHAEDADLTPPFAVELPGEGRYGLRVVVTNPAGYGQRAPQPGDAPQLEIEIDTTAPQAELYQPIPDPKASTNRLLLQWNAKDKHLADGPVSLYFTETPDGPPYQIAADLPASGRYSWEVPQNIPYQVYLVLLARDQANNYSKAVTPQPVVVDLAQPEAEVLGVIALPETPLQR